jgi:hypothetical protein
MCGRCEIRCAVACQADGQGGRKRNRHDLATVLDRPGEHSEADGQHDVDHVDNHAEEYQRGETHADENGNGALAGPTPPPRPKKCGGKRACRDRPSDQFSDVLGAKIVDGRQPEVVAEQISEYLMIPHGIVKPDEAE